MSKSTNLNLNIDELKEFLTHTVSNNNFLQAKGETPLAVCVEGVAGIGKTSVITQLAEELNLQCVKLCLSEIEEVSDLVGFPIRQFQLCKDKPSTSKMIKTIVKKTIQVTENRPVKKQVMIEGKPVIKEVMVPTIVDKEVEEEIESSPISTSGECLWIDEHAISEYTKQGYKFTGQKRMSYCPPEWIAGKGENGIFILDDFSRGDSRYIQATMTLIDKQQYISWSLPKGWTILLSSNPDDGNYQVTSLDIAQSTRFSTVNLKFDIECWMRYAEKTKLDTRCINFLGLHSELVTEKCNPRAITNFFKSISSISDFSTQLPLIQLLGEGSVGPEFSTMFTTFINNKLDKLVTPKDILLHDNESYIIGELRNCIGRGNDYRADIASILTTRLINYTINYAEEHTIHQKTIDRLIKLMTDPDTLTDDLKYILVKRVLNGNKQKFQKLMVDPDVIKMSLK